MSIKNYTIEDVGIGLGFVPTKILFLFHTLKGKS